MTFKFGRGICVLLKEQEAKDGDNRGSGVGMLHVRHYLQGPGTFSTILCLGVLLALGVGFTLWKGTWEMPLLRGSLDFFFFITLRMCRICLLV